MYNEESSDLSPILLGYHYIAIPYDFSNEGTDEIVKAGAIINGKGVCLYDVCKSKNANGALIIHGFINSDKIPNKATVEQKAALPQIYFS